MESLPTLHYTKQTAAVFFFVFAVFLFCFAPPPHDYLMRKAEDGTNALSLLNGSTHYFSLSIRCSKSDSL